MAREEYDVAEAPWRNTALQPMLWFIEAYAALPILLWMVHISWATFCLAFGCIFILASIRYAGYDALSAYRTLQTLIIRALTGGYIRSVPRYMQMD